MSYLQKIKDCYDAAIQYERSKMNLGVPGFATPKSRREWMLKEFPFLESYENRILEIASSVPDAKTWASKKHSPVKHPTFKMEIEIAKEYLEISSLFDYVRKKVANQLFDVVGMNDFEASFFAEETYRTFLMRAEVFLR